MARLHQLGSQAFFIVLAVVGLSAFSSNSLQAQSSRPGMGSIPYAGISGTGVTFRVWAPNATTVGVKGSFSGWSALSLAKESGGLWSVDVAGALPGQEYKYVINNSLDRRDARSRRVSNSAGNSIIYDPTAFDWAGSTNAPPALNDLVIYEMHVGTFNAESWVPNTFDQAINKLDHLVNLGVNAIEVMPISEFAADNSWGYNPADPFAIESALGGPDAFKRFVKACHQRGLSVLVDVIHNHYGPSDLALWQYDGWSQNNLGGIYFYNDVARGTTLWGNTRPDYGRPEVRTYIKDHIRMLLDECRVDGFRWDSVYSMLYYDGGTLPDGASLLNEINTQIVTQYPGRIRIGEDHAFDFPMNFQAKWDVEFHDHLQWQVTRGTDAERNMGWLGDRLASGAGFSHVIYSESHDTAGDLNQKQRLPRYIDAADPTSIWARKRQLLAASTVLTTPGVPMLFQGQEMNEDWTFSSQTALRWGLTNTQQGLVRAYSELVHLRRNRYGNTPGLKGLGVSAFHRDDVNKVIAYVRWDAGGGVDDAVVVENFAVKTWTNNDYLIEFPSAGTWYSHFNGDAKEYGGDFGGIGSAQVVAAGSPPKAAVNMGMYCAQIFTKSPPLFAGVATLNPPQPSGCIPVTVTYAPSNGPLAGASTVVAVMGVNGWSNSVEVALTNNGAGLWSGPYAIPQETAVMDVLFHNSATGNRIWDNNKTRDWHFPVTQCANLPALVTVAPANPPACLPVTITYEERSGPLKNATNVQIFIGRNGWQDNETHVMTEASPGVWVWTMPHAILPDTWQLDYVFNGMKTNLVWDNNNSQNWLSYVGQCAETLTPSVIITNPPGELVTTTGVSTVSIQGRATGPIRGELRWTNILNGQKGTLPALDHWTVGAVPISSGDNLIRISGTNGSFNFNSGARDVATNSVYTSSSSWLNGQNGGTNWGGGWHLSGAVSAGYFLANQSVDDNLDVGARAWGLWANNGGLSEAIRPLADTLHTGDVLRLKFENNWISTGSSVGFGLQNRFGQNLLGLRFVGGGSSYLVDDNILGRDSGLPWTGGGLDVEFQLLTPTTYKLTVGATIINGTLPTSIESYISQLRVWNYNAGTGSEYNLYFTDLQVDGPPLESVVYSDEVTFTLYTSAALRVSPLVIANTVMLGPTPPSWKVDVRNIGVGSMSYSATAEPGLSIVPSSGSNTGEIDVLVLSATNLVEGFTSLTARVQAPNAVSGVQTVRVDLTVVPSIGTALSATGFAWSVSDDALWFIETNITYDGVAAAQSGDISDNGQTWIEAEMTGPGQLLFWWKVSSESGWDPLTLYLDGQATTNWISGTYQDWQLCQLAIPDGVHHVRWVYTKDGSVSSGLDAGWLDNVVLIPPASTCLQVSPLQFSGSVMLGAMIPSWTVEVRNAGSGLMSYTGTVESGLSLTPSSGTSTGETDYLTLSAARLSLGVTTLTARITAPNAVSGVQTVRVQIAVVPSIASSLTANFLPWQFGGDVLWYAQSDVTHDGVSAGRSGAIPGLGRSWIEAEVAGPSRLSFWWKVSSEFNYDYLVVYVDEVWFRSISGERDWQYEVFDLLEGVHRVRWEYSKDASVNWGDDAAWLDDVVVSGQPDRNTNGIPDEWEYRYFANPTGAVLEADSDADRWSNFEEYIADTDPTNVNSVFNGIVRMAGTSPFSFELRGTSSGRLYDISATTNLAPPVVWTPVSGQVLGTGSNLVLTITGAPPVHILRSAVRLP